MNLHSMGRFPVITLLLAAALVRAEEVGIDFPIGGRDLLSSGSLAGAKVSVPKGSDGATSEIQRGGDVPWAEFWRVHVKERPANSWSVQVTSDVKGAIAKGDTCLLVFHARAVEGTASGAASVEVREPPQYPKLGSTQFQVRTKWLPVILPFVANEDGPDGKCAVSIHLGGEVQKVDIGGLRLLNYGPGFPVQKLPQPRFTYDWDAMYVAVIKRIHEHGLPDTQAEFVGEFQEWFARRDEKGEAPDERTIRRRLNPIWRALREPA